jgi:hypothetical protein
MFLTVCSGVLICGDYAWSLGTIPFVLDIDPETGVGRMIAALPVAAIGVIGWSFELLWLDDIPTFRKALRDAPVRRRMGLIAGLTGMALLGIAVLGLNLKLVVDLGTMRSAAQTASGPIGQSVEALDRVQPQINAASLTLGFVAAIDTALLLMLLQAETASARRTIRARHAVRVTRREVTRAKADAALAQIEHDAAQVANDASGKHAHLVADEFRAKAQAALQQRIDTRSLESIVNGRMAVLPIRDAAGDADDGPRPEPFH